MIDSHILNENPAMEYRRFGKTEKIISTITLGGMRFKHGWDSPRNEIPTDTREQCAEVVQLAMKHGINHIETAHGYKKSEHAYGLVLNDDLKIPRNSYYLMTKGAGMTAEGMRKMVEEQLEALKTDYFDFYGWHGLNNAELFKVACASGGPVEELHKLKEEGIIRHIGFSTHAPLEVILDAINTNLFEFVNLHYYYIFQRNLPAVELAAKKDMGVFIISPNDKGGRLFEAPEKLKKVTAPSTPIQWNARNCLANPAIHTLSFGMTEASHFDEMRGIFPSSIPLSEQDKAVKDVLDQLMEQVPYSNFHGYELQGDATGINIPEILRFRRLLKAFDMVTYGKYRYNMFEPKEHWFPGVFPTPGLVEQIDTRKISGDIPLKDLILETHEALYKPKEEEKVIKLPENIKLK